VVVAASTARFGLPEVKRGLMPDFGGAFRVARMLPANIARELSTPRSAGTKSRRGSDRTPPMRG
jgi:enoyl-CoA hydratase/carnithine racemase